MSQNDNQFNYCSKYFEQGRCWCSQNGINYKFYRNDVMDVMSYYGMHSVDQWFALCLKVIKYLDRAPHILGLNCRYFHPSSSFLPCWTPESGRLVEMTSLVGDSTSDWLFKGGRSYKTETWPATVFVQFVSNYSSITLGLFIYLLFVLIEEHTNNETRIINCIF